MAITLDHSNSWAYDELGLTLMYLGQPKAGIPYIEKAMRLNSSYPNIGYYYWGLGACNLLLGEVDQAIELLRRRVPQSLSGTTSINGSPARSVLADDLDGSKAALAESLNLNPEISSLAQFRARRPWGNARYWQLFDQTAATGLRRADFPE
jgi:tetratricopeptide (TPR) repeat protein